MIVVEDEFIHSCESYFYLNYYYNSILIKAFVLLLAYITQESSTNWKELRDG
jgi:hypothetical protein